MNDPRFDPDPLDRLMPRSRAEAEQAAIAVRDDARLAGLDRLTELPPFGTLIDRFALAAAIADRHDGRMALMLVGLDRTLRIDDGVDREAGDRRVVEVARRLAASVRAADTVCRLTGARFVVLLTDVARDSDAASASRNVQRSLEGEAGTSPVACSIGISFYPDHGRDVETLIGRADAAMDRATSPGAGHLRSYDDAAGLEGSTRRSVVSPVDRRRVRRARSTATVGLHDEREIDEALRRASIRVRDERDRAQQHLRIALAAADMAHWAVYLASGETVRSVGHDRLFGYAASLPCWTPDVALECFVPEDRAAVAAAWHEARTSGFVDFEHCIRRADDGQVRWLHVSGETVYEHGIASRIVGIVTDVTDRRAAEAERTISRKRQAVDGLTAGVAHDLDDLLREIGGSVDVLARRIAADERPDRLLGAIRRAIDDGRRLQRRLLGLARRSDVERVVPIGSLLPVFEALLKSAVNEAIVVEVSCEDAVRPCLVDGARLEVSLLDLAVDARDAMPDGGRLTLHVGDRLVDDAEAGRWGARGGAYVSIEIADSGAGIGDGAIERAFEPMHTPGTGSGLCRVGRFAKSSGGFASIRRGAARGTTVTIHLPRLVPAGRERARDPARGAVGTVLVVEGDPGARATVNAMLCDLGYEVIEADAADAARAMVTSDTPVDLVLGDVVDILFGDVVDDVVEQGRQRGGVPIVLASARTGRCVIPDALVGRLHVLQKPYTRSALATVLHDALGARSSGVDAG